MSNSNCNVCSSKTSCPILKSEILQKYLDDELDCDLTRDISKLCMSLQSHALSHDEALEYLSNLMHKIEVENSKNTIALVQDKIVTFYPKDLMLKVEQIVLWHNCLNRVSAF